MSPQNETNFTPSKRQLQFVDFLRAQRDPCSIRQLCGAGPVSRATLYRWQTDESFNAWLGRHAATILHNNFALIWITASQAAVTGDDRLAEILMKYSANPKGAAALEAFLAHPSPWAPPPHADGSRTDPPAPTATACEVGEAAPKPSGAIAVTYRALLDIQGQITPSDLRAAKRTDDFGKHMENIRRHVRAEEQARESVLGPPPLFGPNTLPLNASNPDIESLAGYRWDGFARRIGRANAQINDMELRQLRAECRGDLIAAKAGHVCRVQNLTPAAIPTATDADWRTFHRQIEEDTEPAACDHPDPPGGPTGLEFLQAFRAGDLETARRGLRAGLPIHLRSTNNLTPFSIAARNGQIEMFEFACRAAQLPPGEVPEIPRAPLRPTNANGDA